MRRTRAFHLPLLLLVGGIACAVHLTSVWHPNRFLTGDGSFYFGVSRHLYEAGTLEQHGNHPSSWYELDMGWNHNLDAGWSNVALGRDDQSWYPKHPLVLPVIASPFLYAFGPWGALLFNWLICALLLGLCYRVGDALGGPGAGLAGGLILALTPVFADQSWSFSNDVLQAVLVLWSVDLALRDRPTAGGLILGLAVLAKMTSVLLLPGFVLLYLLRRDVRGGLQFAATSSLGIGTYAITNWILYGSPFLTGYHRILVRIDGVLQIYSHTSDFFTFSDLPAHLLKIGSGAQGLLVRTPYLVFAPLGLGLLALRRRFAEAALLTALLAIPVLFHAAYGWYRIAFLLPAIALAAALAGQFLVLGRAPEVKATAGRLRAVRIYAAVAALLFAIGGLQRVLSDPPRLLSERIREARVGQGEVPCDYFNNQSWQWECSGFDRGSDLLMTGPAVSLPLKAGGEERRVIRLTPRRGPGVRWIAWSLPTEGSCTLHLEHGLEDGYRGRASIEVVVDGAPIQTFPSTPGWQEHSLPLPSGGLELRLQARGTPRAPLGLDGTIDCD